MTKTRKIFLALLIIFTMLFSYFIPISKVYAENNYRISLDFINKLDSVPGISISKIYINNVEWNSKNDIFYSADDKYTIRIDYSNSTDTDPVIIYAEAWRGKIEESIFKLKGCHYNILVDNSSHNENLVISFTQQFPVSFETNGGSTIDSKSVELNNKLLKPTDPTKEGYAFDGWYEDEELNKSFDFDTPITKNLTLYAKWIKAYTVTFKDGENVLFTRNNITSAEKLTIPEKNPLKEGYEFKGWYADAALTTEFDFNIPITQDTCVYAKYEKTQENPPIPPATRTIIWANSDYNEDAKTDDYNEDAILSNGKAKVIAIYDEEGNKISGEQEVDKNGLGFITASKNQKVVFEFTPNYGYQLTKILANGFELEPQDALNQYIFTMPDTNVHFAATFTKVDDIVKADSKKVSSGAIVLANNELDAGTARLSVKDIELSDEKIEKFKNVAGEYEIKSYLDINLDQIFYKGSNDESNVWEKKIDTLSNKATITLKLADGITADDIVIVHNIHDGENYEIIEIESYDLETNTITFKTNSFSNYAIATKTSSNINNDTPTNTNDNPKTGDSIYVYIGLIFFAMEGIIITTKSLKKSK